MSRLAAVRQAFATVRYLRWRQVYWQLRRRLRRPRLLTELNALASARALRLTPPLSRQLLYLGAGSFRFLNQTADLRVPIDWTAQDLPLLWRYNLHYFDYLHQSGLSRETGFALMRDWVTRHPPRSGAVGWEPYVLSLRIVNWLKFMSIHQEFPGDVLVSVALQVENLRRQIEYHLLGNHLFANAKALWFAGVFLDRGEWTDLGKSIVLDQLPEQFLSDGGHFELSPMYHALALEDLLDLVNLCHATGDAVSAKPLDIAARGALEWLRGISAADGSLPLLNDSANAISPTLPELAAYAARLGIDASSIATPAHEFEHGWRGRSFSGYWVLTDGVFRIVFDAANLGPDYLPGHAHCDMLSVLLEFQGSPVLVDTGVFEYAETPRRMYSRSTAAHNTVQIDGLEQGDIWKSFRMGRRGHPRGLSIGNAELSCEHDGFAIQRRGLRHRRNLRLLDKGFEIVDQLVGPARHEFVARFHFAPELGAEIVAPSVVQVSAGLVFTIAGADAAIETSEYYPEFGLIEQRACLVIRSSFHRVHELRITCTSSS